MNLRFHFDWMEFVTSLVSFTLKIFAGWATWSILSYFGAPLWLTITLMIMAVNSTFIKYKRH